MKILVADTETSGFSGKDGIVQLAYIEINPDLEVIAEFDTLVDPECPISPGASGVHGLVDADVVEAPTMPELMEEILIPRFGKFEDVLLIAHNCSFDLRFLKHHWGVTGTLCTLKLARKLLPDAPDHKLQTLRYHLKLDVPEAAAHSARGDALVLLALLKHLIAMGDMDLFELVGYHLRPEKITHMPFGKHKGTVIADLPGSYKLWLLALPDLDETLRWSLTT